MSGSEAPSANQELKIISLNMPVRIGTVNCYLIKSGLGYVLIDTGSSNSRKRLLKELESAGCLPHLLKSVLITHGDFDHTGNAACLRRAYGGRIGMHPDDQAMAERGDMFSNRRRPNVLVPAAISVVYGFRGSQRFSPDFVLSDGQDLALYGLEARVLHLPGHSKGSVGILTSDGGLFCGDLLSNTDRPALNPIMDNVPEGRASLQKLRAMGVEAVYPGHGRPFFLHQITDPAP